MKDEDSTELLLDLKFLKVMDNLKAHKWSDTVIDEQLDSLKIALEDSRTKFKLLLKKLFRKIPEGNRLR